MINFETADKIFKLIDIPIFIRDKNNNYVFCNDAFLNLFNITENQIIGKNIKDIFIDEYNDFLITDEFIDKQNKQNVFEFYCKALKKHFLVIKTFFFNQNEKFIIGAILDITNIKIRDEQIVKNTHLMFLNQFERILLISGLMNNLSHQLSQPLNAIKILVDSNLKFNQDHNLNDQHIEDLYFISDQIERLEKIINNLKYIENSNTNNDISLVSIALSVYNALELLGNELHEENIIVDTSLNNKYKVYFPKYYLEYIVSNIILYISQHNFDNKKISIITSEIDDKVILSFRINNVIDFSILNKNNIFSLHQLNQDLPYKIIFAAINNIFQKHQVEIFYQQYDNNNTELKILFNQNKGMYEDSTS